MRISSTAATVDFDLRAGAVCDDGSIDVADVVPGEAVAELEHDAVVAFVPRGSNTGEE